MLIGDGAIGMDAVAEMRKFVSKKPSTRFAAYQNHDLGSRAIGSLRFLAIGPECTLQTPPHHYPDTPMLGIGWRFAFVGWANLDTRKVESV